MKKSELLNAIEITINSNADSNTKIEDIIENINRYHEELAEELRLYE